MARKEINWKVERNDVKEIIEPINIEIPIDRGQYNYIFRGEKLYGKSLNVYFSEKDIDVINKLYPNDEYKSLKRLLFSKLSLNFIPDFKNNNWIIGYSPVEIFNNIFEVLNINERLDYIDYNDKKQVEDTKHKVNLILINEKLKLLGQKDPSNKLQFINDTINNIYNIFEFNGFDIETRLSNKITYKNLLYYLAVKSLDRLDETDDIKYAMIPRVYYHEVTSKGIAEWPNQLSMADGVYSYTGSTFNDRYNEVLLRYPILFEKELNINEICVMDKLEIVRADNFIDDVEVTYNDYVDTIKKKKTYTRTNKELNDMLNDKISFYRYLMNLKDEKGENVVVSPIKGINELNGYYGFVLNNNYIVLDKFFTTRKTDNKVKPSMDEAIYSMPLDLFVNLNGSKRKMMEYIKKNPKGNVRRNYHTKKHSYRDNIINITKKEDVSSMKHDWFLPIYSPKKLVLEK